MRRKDEWKKIVALALSAAMMVGVAGCGNNDAGSQESGSTQQSGESSSEESSEEEKSSEADESEASTEGSTEGSTSAVGWAADLGDQEWTGEQVTLSLVSEFSPDPSSSTAWVEDVFRKYTGVTFNRESSQNGKFDTILTSGELTDIIGFGDPDDALAAAEAGKLINLDDYKDQLPNIYQNPLMDSALKFWRENRFTELGGLYGAPLAVGNNDTTTGIPMIRYDLYEKIGSPQPATMEDYFQMLKDMNDINKTAEDGDPCYAVLGWDGPWAFSQDWIPFYGWYSLSTGIYAKGDGSVVTTIFDEDVPMKRLLKGMNDLWNNGYVHPDSITMDYATAKPMFDSGHGLVVTAEWMGGKYNDIHTDETGNMTVWADDFEVYIESDWAVGNSQCLSISADCENLDAALRFLNWYYSPTAYNIIKNGPEGYLWEYTDDGKQTFTADGIERFRTNREEIGSGGDLFNAQQFLNSQPYTTYVLNPTTGQPLYHEYWDAFFDTEKRWGQLEWRRQTGFTRTVEMARAKGAKTRSMAFSLIPTIDSDLEASKNAIADACKTYSWKIAVAKDDAEFESLWTEFQAECEALGLQDVYNWYKTKFEEAQSLAEKYPLKTSWD